MPLLSLRSLFANTVNKLAGYTLISDSGSWTYTGISTSGQQVNQASSMTYSAVWAAVRAISEGVASLPLQVFRRGHDGSRSKANDHPLYRILHDQPNPEMSALTFRETLMGHALVWGNGYAEIVRDKNSGRVQQLWPLDPSLVEPVRDENGELYYKYGQIIFLPAEILHIKGLSFDGVKGYSVIAQAKNSIGLGMAVEEFGSTFFGQGGKPAGVISVPGKLNSEAIQNMRKSWEDMHATVKNAHRVAILQNGVTYQTIGTPPDDAQWIASRSFQLQEVARWFKIPASKIGAGAGTYSSLEQDNLAFLQETLRPWLIRWEQEINFKLISSLDQLYAEHNQDALLRGDTAGRSAFYASALSWGWLSRNDVRALENLPPFEGGDAYMIPKNMDPAFGPGQTPAAVDQAKTLGQMPTQAPAPDPIPAPAPQQNAFGFAKLLEAARKQIRKIEANHLGRISNKPGEFIPALEKFLEAHQERVQIILEPVMEFIQPESGGGVRAAADHCEALKVEWLDLAGSATPRNLKLLADEKLTNWIDTKANWEKTSWLN
jgi:HK97 family phage portal protein